MNSVCVSGRIASMDEMKSTSGGKKYLDFQIAFSHSKEKTSYVPARAWEKSAELIVKHFNVGEVLGVTGVLVRDQWKDKNNKHYEKTYVSVEKVDLSLVSLNKKSQSSNENSNSDSGGYEPKPPF